MVVPWPIFAAPSWTLIELTDCFSMQCLAVKTQVAEICEPEQLAWPFTNCSAANGACEMSAALPPTILGLGVLDAGWLLEPVLQWIPLHRTRSRLRLRPALPLVLPIS
ncbi:hypothetical protein GCM10009569_30130 [Arthrobacter russicus]